ncbi:MAG: ABC transporter ATP-binding protein [Hyphomicrobiales bacterium]|nr:ABC transporter ATP-binding protein [Hyphomicrobiales bacterium]MCP4999187.1 ABC transporter ATP-binding protein [Hyphomicrobiales bacterium]
MADGEYTAHQESPVKTPIAELRGVSKRFGSVLAANNLNLEISEGEFLSFLGPSGCGKTTALRLLAGFESPTEGDVLLDGEVVNSLDAHLRPVNMVFQHYALFPHLTVAQNIGYGLKQRRPRVPKAIIAQKVEQALEIVRLEGFGERRIWEMSGGQQQRVALARATVNEPKLLLLDEPLAALDRKLRKEMQIELQNIQRRLGITFVLVTHDQEEALSMSDRICIMRDGQIEQVGSPQELYDRPANRYVASFVGTTNFFDGTITGVDGDRACILIENGQTVTGWNASGYSTNDPVSLCVRPEQIHLSHNNGSGEALAVLVLNRIFQGEQTEYLVRHDTFGEFLVLAPRQSELNEGPFNVDEWLFASWDASGALILSRNQSN